MSLSCTDVFYGANIIFIVYGAYNSYFHVFNRFFSSGLSLSCTDVFYGANIIFIVYGIYNNFFLSVQHFFRFVLILHRCVLQSKHYSYSLRRYNSSFFYVFNIFFFFRFVLILHRCVLRSKHYFYSLRRIQ